MRDYMILRVGTKRQTQEQQQKYSHGNLVELTRCFENRLNEGTNRKKSWNGSQSLTARNRLTTNPRLAGLHPRPGF